MQYSMSSLLMTNYFNRVLVSEYTKTYPKLIILKIAGMRNLATKCATLALLAVAPAASIDAACTSSVGENGSVTVYYDTATQKVVVSAVLPDNSFAGFGWGSAMANTEMLIFSANSDASSVTAYKGGSGHSDPTVEASL